MHTDARQGRNDATGSAPSAASTVLRRSPTVTAAGAGSRTDCDSVRPSSKGSSSRPDITSCSKEAAAAAAAADDEPANAAAPAADDAAVSASSSKAFAGILGYEELGHVPTLDEFRSEWSKLKSQADFALAASGPGDPGGSKGSRWRQQDQGGGQAQQQGPGSVVNELSKRDEVFRHFKKYYDKADHSERRIGDALFPTGVNSTGLLQPDFEVIDAVGRHTAQSQESRCQSRIGEGLLSAPGDGGTSGAARRGDRVRQRSRDVPRTSREVDADGGGGGEGFTNVFLESSALGSEGFHRNPDDGVAANPFLSRSRHDASRPATGSPGGDGKGGGLEGTFSGSLTNSSRPNRVGGTRGPCPSRCKGGGAENGRAKSSVEGSSTSAELQVSEVGGVLQRKSDVLVASRLRLGPPQKPGRTAFPREKRILQVLDGRIGRGCVSNMAPFYPCETKASEKLLIWSG